MISVTPLVAQPGVALTGTLAVVATAAGLMQFRSVLVSNPTTAAVALAISLARNGGAPLALVPSLTIPAGACETISALTGLVLNAGDSLSASGAGLNLFASGLGIGS